MVTHQQAVSDALAPARDVRPAAAPDHLVIAPMPRDPEQGQVLVGLEF